MSIWFYLAFAAFFSMGCGFLTSRAARLQLERDRCKEAGHLWTFDNEWSCPQCSRCGQLVR